MVKKCYLFSEINYTLRPPAIAFTNFKPFSNTFPVHWKHYSHVVANVDSLTPAPNSPVGYLLCSEVFNGVELRQLCIDGRHQPLSGLAVRIAPLAFLAPWHE